MAGDWFTPEISRVSRGRGDAPATAKAAYRSGERILDERTAEVHDYRAKQGIEVAFLVMPDHAPALSRAELWNLAEKAETRKNSVTAREMVLPLPADVTAAQRREIAQEVARFLTERYGVAVDVALHRPDPKGDNRNWHGHFQFTTRRMERDGLGEKTRELDDKVQGPREFEIIREAAANATNRQLERAGLSYRVDHRSYERRGIEREAGQHMGPKASAMERRGETTRIGEFNRAVAARNHEREELKREAEVIDLALEREKRESEAREKEKAAQKRQAEQARKAEALRRRSEARQGQRERQGDFLRDKRQQDSNAPEIWDREAAERDRLKRETDAAIAADRERAKAEQEARAKLNPEPGKAIKVRGRTFAENRAAITATRTQFDEWVRRKQGQFRAFHLQERHDLIQSHHNQREGLAAELQRQNGQDIRNLEAALREIEARSQQGGLRGMIYRISGKAGQDRADEAAARKGLENIKWRMAERTEPLKERQAQEMQSLTQRQQERMSKLEQRIEILNRRNRDHWRSQPANDRQSEAKPKERDLLAERRESEGRSQPEPAQEKPGQRDLLAERGYGHPAQERQGERDLLAEAREYREWERGRGEDDGPDFERERSRDFER